MTLTFDKYQGAGNDFVIMDDRKNELLPRLDQPTIERLCDRRFGIGADGLMLLADGGPDYDFRMVYFNADGRESTMCGNGGRCIVHFAHRIGIHRDSYRFVAIDGPHDARLLADGTVALGMNPVREVQEKDQDLVLDTGSPHYLRFVDTLEGIDVVASGRAIRQSPAFRERGINVNFVQASENGLRIATYERGVEDETLACGTGVTAAAVGYLYRYPDMAANQDFHIPVRARGGNLAVTGRRTSEGFTDLCLLGPATYVYHGTIEI